jgi:malate dehydrogenase (oxaloacetate-decarboxylating)
MQQKVVPHVMPALQKSSREVPCGHKTSKRGIAVLTTPLLNKGSAFSKEERQNLQLDGLLPPVISTLESQVTSAYSQYQRLPDALGKNIYMTALHDRNEVLFFRLLSEHLREMIPIVNDRTVGLAIEQSHHECRRPRGVYLSIHDPDGIESAFRNLGVGPGDIDLILATDAEQIFGIGDWGVGGIEIAIGKLAIYTAAGGIDPARVIPVMIDVGTNRRDLRADPMYPGNRHDRVRGERYDSFIGAFLQTAAKLFPGALLQIEDFALSNARRILNTYGPQYRLFSDDLQGTGAVTLAAAISAIRVGGIPLRNQRVVIYGAGTAGIGIADLLCKVMVTEGLSPEAAKRRIWCVDVNGLITDDMGAELPDYHKPYARLGAEMKGWKRGDGSGKLSLGSATGIDLAGVVHQVRPTMLIGASGRAGAFTEAIIRNMAWHTDRPIIFPLSTPASHSEATAADLITWTDGRALIATGGLFSPVTHKGITHVIGQLNNAMLYPGIGLGVIVSRARYVSVGMLEAAANALSSLVAVRLAGATLLPHIEDLRQVTVTVAIGVAEAAVQEGLAMAKLPNIAEQIQAAMWQPEYRAIEAC